MLTTQPLGTPHLRLRKSPYNNTLSIMCSCNSTHAQERGTLAGNGSLLMLFQAAFGLPIAFSAIVKGSVIEMKPTAGVAKDIMVSLKATSQK